MPNPIFARYWKTRRHVGGTGSDRASVDPNPVEPAAGGEILKVSYKALLNKLKVLKSRNAAQNKNLTA